jgi:hypothetical protein
MHVVGAEPQRLVVRGADKICGRVGARVAQQLPGIARSAWVHVHGAPGGVQVNKLPNTGGGGNRCAGEGGRVVFVVHG